MNKTMTIIELLNKIANGEGVPKIIRYKNYVFEYYERLDDVYNYKVIGSDAKYLNDVFFIDNILNDEIEIIEIEDNDKLEKINVKTGDNCKRFIEYDDETGHHKYTIRLLDEYFAKNINKIINHINKIEEKLDER